MATLTEFGKQVKIKLIQMDKPQKWLNEEVVKRTGLYFDDSYLHRIVTGKSNNHKIVSAIKEILEIED